jgi:hypothetical protein
MFQFNRLDVMPVEAVTTQLPHPRFTDIELGAICHRSVAAQRPDSGLL